MAAPSQAQSNPETKMEIVDIGEDSQTYHEPIVDIADDNFMPIKALNTFTRDWVIKARVSQKEMRTTKNGGQLLKLELVDSHGTPIEATFFNDDAKKWNS